jgi:hypothetical protein
MARLGPRCPFAMAAAGSLVVVSLVVLIIFPQSPASQANLWTRGVERPRPLAPMPAREGKLSWARPSATGDHTAPQLRSRPSDSAAPPPTARHPRDAPFAPLAALCAAAAGLLALAFAGWLTAATRALGRRSRCDNLEWSAAGVADRPTFRLVPLAKPPKDPRVLLRRSEESHAALTRRYGRIGVSGVKLQEVIVSVRSKPGARVVPELCVWVPIASVVTVASPVALTGLSREALVATFRREIVECVEQASFATKRVNRLDLEYAAEGRESWDANVADRKRYSKTDARYKDLGLDVAADLPAIQAAWRRLSVELRPENFADPQAKQDAAKRLQRAQDAYNVLGGVYKNGLYYWYSALEGNGRPDFAGPLDLTGHPIGGPLPGSEVPPEEGGLRAAVARLRDPVTTDIMRFNVVRHNEGIAPRDRGVETV